ncbi:MurR/RpiR family transcriptional regulator [Alloyangia pacifica]|uniref:Transcriptional regulator, RpiR family n=1 Tax=Alloyangia pacifica TaxID=311180 RepID=A0A1I6UWU6_9RHOB|nr:MurR/RpiR family transcriptional regulator [Alloyangia pacifica]SDI28825.1 transcriptional regulator, RpiR family [Alloyangia pacifica]SFT05892.1 transcriptional regulator, RpiR family [Alloyangia pacifica]
MSQSSDLMSRIQDRAVDLTQSEERLVAELIKAPRDVALLSAAAFADRAGLHEATCSRLARKLGYDSYAAFRRALQHTYLGGEPAARMASTLKEAGADPLHHLIGLEIASLSGLTDHISAAQIADAADLLTGRRVFLFAHGNACVLAEQAERRLRRMSLDARRLQGSARDLAEGALALRGSDAVILFAFRRQPPGYAALMGRAAEVGARTLVLADEIGPVLRPAADQILAAPRTGVPEGFQTLTVPMLILNALILALGRRSEALSSLSDLSRLIAAFEQDGEK